MKELPGYKINWQAFFFDTNELDKIKKRCHKIKYDYLMLINSNCLFEPEQFKNLLQKIENSPKINILSAKSLDNKTIGLEFTLIRNSGLEKSNNKIAVDHEIIVGYEKKIIWR
jgi:hypothetical protein